MVLQRSIARYNFGSNSTPPSRKERNLQFPVVHHGKTQYWLEGKRISRYQADLNEFETAGYIRDNGGVSGQRNAACDLLSHGTMRNPSRKSKSLEAPCRLGTEASFDKGRPANEFWLQRFLTHHGRMVFWLVFHTKFDGSGSCEEIWDTRALSSRRSDVQWML